MSASGCSNFKYPIVLACYKFKKQTNISILEFKALRLKRKFGTEYLTLVGESAPVKELEMCLGASLKEFKALLTEIEENKKLIEEKEKRTNQKLGIVTRAPPPPPKLVEKPPVYYLPPPPRYRTNQHQAPRPRGRPRRRQSPPRRKPRSVTNVDNDIDCDSGHTHICSSIDGSTHSTMEPKKKKKPKRKGRRKK